MLEGVRRAGLEKVRHDTVRRLEKLNSCAATRVRRPHLFVRAQRAARAAPNIVSEPCRRPAIAAAWRALEFGHRSDKMSSDSDDEAPEEVTAVAVGPMQMCCVALPSLDRHPPTTDGNGFSSRRQGRTRALQQRKEEAAQRVLCVFLYSGSQFACACCPADFMSMSAGDGHHPRLHLAVQRRLRSRDEQEEMSRLRLAVEPLTMTCFCQTT